MNEQKIYREEDLIHIEKGGLRLIGVSEKSNWFIRIYSEEDLLSAIRDCYPQDQGGFTIIFMQDNEEWSLLIKQFWSPDEEYIKNMYLEFFNMGFFENGVVYRNFDTYFSQKPVGFRLNFTLFFENLVLQLNQSAQKRISASEEYAIDYFRKNSGEEWEQIVKDSMEVHFSEKDEVLIPVFLVNSIFYWLTKQKDFIDFISENYNVSILQLDYDQITKNILQGRIVSDLVERAL